MLIDAGWTTLAEVETHWSFEDLREAVEAFRRISRARRKAAEKR